MYNLKVNNKFDNLYSKDCNQFSYINYDKDYKNVLRFDLRDCLSPRTCYTYTPTSL